MIISGGVLFGGEEKRAAGIGYGSINHPVDRDPICVYTGIINEVCPKCGRREEEHGYAHERMKRFTGGC